MANRTVKDAHTIKGTNPQYLIEKIVRTRIYESKYWKEECFALTAELIVDKALELKFIGGVYGGNVKPTPFLCLLLKMLQIQPEKDIIVQFISQQDYKYARALGAMYMRLTGTALDCYKYLEPLYLDYRKIKRQNRMGTIDLVYMDEFVEQLLTEERIFDTILPRIQKRFILEINNELEARMSALVDDDVEELESSEEEGEFKDSHRALAASPADVKANYRDWDRPRRSPSPRFRRSRSPVRRRGASKEREQRKDRERDRDRGDRDRERDRDRKDREKRRRRSHSRERDRDRENQPRYRREEKDLDNYHHRSRKNHRDGI